MRSPRLLPPLLASALALACASSASTQVPAPAEPPGLGASSGEPRAAKAASEEGWRALPGEGDLPRLTLHVGAFLEPLFADEPGIQVTSQPPLVPDGAFAGTDPGRSAVRVSRGETRIWVVGQLVCGPAPAPADAARSYALEGQLEVEDLERGDKLFRTAVFQAGRGETPEHACAAALEQARAGLGAHWPLEVLAYLAAPPGGAGAAPEDEGLVDPTEAPSGAAR